jgi:hypothetical protein
LGEVVHVFDMRVRLNDAPYAAQVAARREGHVWEGWIEFVAEDGSDVRRTPRETTQPDLDAILYWARGLSATYLEGALQRTLPRSAPTAPPRGAAGFEAPAPRPHALRRSDSVAIDHAVLDPFNVAAQGETFLRRELAALTPWHLRNIIRAYGLADAHIGIERLDQRELIELIVMAVQPA